MLSATHSFKEQPEFKSLTGPLIGSSIFHLIILVMAIVGLPMLQPALPVIEKSITVEIVELDEYTRSHKTPTKVNDMKIKTKPLHKPKAIIKPKPTPPKNLAMTPPKPVNPSAPVLNDEVALPREAKAPTPRDKPQVKKPVDQPKPRERKLFPSVPEEQQEKFEALLRNISPEEQSQVSSEAEQVSDKTQKQIPFAQRMTMNEQDALKRQLSMCWNVSAGARFAENLIVRLKLSISRNRIVQTATIVDQIRYNIDSYYKAAADSALRAVKHPRCTPLDLPIDKYEQWKSMTVTFDPRDMLQ